MNLRHTRRIFVNDPLTQGTVLPASPEHTHYLDHVLRMKSGDVLRIFNGRDGEHRATVHSAGKKKIELHIHEQLRAQSPEPDLWLCCAPIKKAHFENMLEKATELGVSEIQPHLTARTQVRTVNDDRAYGICCEAAEQSERLTVPAVGAPVTLDDLVDVFPDDRAMIVCAELGDATPIEAALRDPHLSTYTSAAVITGPEGGFTDEELSLLRQKKQAFFVRLGPRILRADTAAIATLACWQALRGDWTSL